MIARQVSRPMRSARARGPMGWFMPSFITVSISSGLPTLWKTQNIASLIIGIRILLAMNPGKSLASAGVFPNFLLNSHVISNVSSEVGKPLITSTSFITGTGFIKCMPITFSGRLVRAAMRPMGMDEVLVERIVWDGQILSRSSKILNFKSSLSTAASTTKSTSAISLRSTVVLILPRITSISACSSFPLATFLERFFVTAATPLTVNSSLISLINTSSPLAAATWAMPLPIWPAPMTPNFLISMIDSFT